MTDDYVRVPREALEPFAKVATDYYGDKPIDDNTPLMGWLELNHITWGDVRRIASLLSAAPPPPARDQKQLWHRLRDAYYSVVPGPKSFPPPRELARWEKVAEEAVAALASPAPAREAGLREAVARIASVSKWLGALAKRRDTDSKFKNAIEEFFTGLGMLEGIVETRAAAPAPQGEKP